MYKRISQITALGLGVLALSSCATYVNHDVKINSMDSISYAGTVGFEDNSDATQVVDEFTKDFESDLQVEGYKVKDFKTEGVVGKTYTFNNLSLDEYRTIDSSFSLDKVDGKVTFITDTDDDVDAKFNQVSITMPGKIITAEGAVNVNGKTATWDANSYTGDSYVVVSKDKTSILVPLGGAALIVLLGVGAFMHVRKNKAKPSTTITPTIPPEM